jgi:enamine deaminase RidA (YjgF/YER057c/UK114 family)
MERSEINPWDWSKAFGFSQGVRIRGSGELLICSGQTALGPDGTLSGNADMGSQVKKAFENLGAVLAGAGFTAGDVLRVNYFTTDVDGLIRALPSVARAFFDAHLPASTLVGVTRLAYPELTIEIEAIAAR